MRCGEWLRVADSRPFGEQWHHQSCGSAAQISGCQGGFGNQTRAILWRMRLDFLSVAPGFACLLGV